MSEEKKAAAVAKEAEEIEKNEQEYTAHMAENEADEAKAKAAEVVQEVVAPKRAEIPTPPMVIQSPWGDVSVYGCHLVSPAILSMCSIAITSWDEYHLSEGLVPEHHGVHVIVFRDDGFPHNENGGKSIHAHCQPTMGGIAINLEHTFTRSVEETIEVPRVSIYANILHNILFSLGHEIYHANQMYGNLARELADDEEKLANEFATQYSYFLTSNYPVNAGPLNEEPFFGKQVLDALQSFIGDGPAEDEDTAFAKEQQMMALEGIMYWAKGKDDEERILKSFREYIHWTSSDKLDDPKWMKLYETDAERNVREALVASVAPVATAVINPAVVVQAPAAGTAPLNPTMEMNAYTGKETEVHEVDPYLDMVMDEEPPWDVEPTPAVAPAVAAAVQPVAVAPAAAAPTLMPNSSGMAHGLSPAQVGECCIAVYRRLFNNLFTRCEQVNIDNTTIRPDGQGGGCGGFNNVAAIQTPLPISDIPNADKIFVQQDAKVDGKWSKGVAIAGTAIGSDTGNKTMLPKYDLYIINDQGHMEKRTLLPQNPWKIKAGGMEFSKPAVEAQGGKRIMYIYSQNDMKLKVLAEQNADGTWREWLEDANWNIIG